jgi:predicted transcriptional regulator
VSEDLLRALYEAHPLPQTTHELAVALGRDEEYVLKVAQSLVEQKLIYHMEKNVRGTTYKRRKPWALTPEAYEKYERVLGGR